MTEDWEQSFLPLDDPRAIHPPVSQCANCGEVVNKDTAAIVHYDEPKQYTAFFCGNHCKSEHYLWRIRKGG